MRPHGGFDHNAQSLRIVELIESNYPRFPGLNLSFEVTEGLRKHQTFYDAPPGKTEGYACPSLEAQIANLADEITYYSHDLDDGLDADLISADQLADLSIWKHAKEEACEEAPELDGRELCATIIRRLINREAEDVVATSAARIEAAGVRSTDDVRRQPRPLISYSEELLAANRELRRFLYGNLYFHPQVKNANQRACERLTDVFNVYMAHPNASARRPPPASPPRGCRARSATTFRHDGPLPVGRTRAAIRRAVIPRLWDARCALRGDRPSVSSSLDRSAR